MSSPDSKDMDGLPGNIEGILWTSHMCTHMCILRTPFYKYTHPFTNIHTPKIRLHLFLLFNDVFLPKTKIYFFHIVYQPRNVSVKIFIAYDGWGRNQSAVESADHLRLKG